MFKKLFLISRTMRLDLMDIFRSTNLLSIQWCRIFSLISLAQTYELIN